jgi:hypothetical protein
MFHKILWELNPTHPVRRQIRTAYFSATGHYGSEEEIKTWFLAQEKLDRLKLLKNGELASA